MSCWPSKRLRLPLFQRAIGPFREYRRLDLPNNPTTQADRPPNIKPTLCAIAMPMDTNPHGDIFGGWLLSQMDLAGTTVATRRSKGRTVTVAITGMTVHRPVFVGDEVSCTPSC